MWQAIMAAVGLLISAVGGYTMTTLASQSGNSLAEVYYHQVGWLGIGLGVLLFVVCISLGQMVGQNQKVIALLTSRENPPVPESLPPL